MTAKQSAAEGVRYLVLQAGQVRCAVPVHQVRRVVRAVPVYALPGSTQDLLGLAEIEGEPIPVLDLARLIQAPPGGTPACPVYIIAETGSSNRRERIALAADAAEEIVMLPPGGLAGPAAGLIQGEAVAGGQPVRVLNLAALEEE